MYYWRALGPYDTYLDMTEFSWAQISLHLCIVPSYQTRLVPLGSGLRGSTRPACFIAIVIPAYLQAGKEYATRRWTSNFNL